MTTSITMEQSLDVALLPLEDGRRLMLPLKAMAEMLRSDGRDIGDILEWRGQRIEVESLDGVCGLARPPRGRCVSVGIFRAAADSERPFRAFAIAGIAAHKRVSAGALESSEVLAGGAFAGTTRLEGEDYLLPDLGRLLYG